MSPSSQSRDLRNASCEVGNGRRASATICGSIGSRLCRAIRTSSRAAKILACSRSNGSRNLSVPGNMAPMKRIICATFARAKRERESPGRLGRVVVFGLAKRPSDLACSPTSRSGPNRKLQRQRSAGRPTSRINAGQSRATSRLPAHCAAICTLTKLDAYI